MQCEKGLPLSLGFFASYARIGQTRYVSAKPQAKARSGLSDFRRPCFSDCKKHNFGSESGTGLRVAGFLLCRKIEKADVPFSKRASSDVFSNVGTHGRPRCVVIDNLGHKGARMNLHDGFRAL
jgi:hypothetical protein